MVTTRHAPGAIVYIVDDDDSIRKSLRRLFQTHGFAVQDYTSGNAFLEGMQAPTVGCLILDFNLPGLSGLETLTRARSLGWTLPVIIITGIQDSSLEEFVRRSGAWAFLRKPLDPQILLSTVEEAVRAHSKSLE